MPLIVMVGIPCSGKTTRAHQIQAHFKEKEKDVIIINEESLALNKNEYYSSKLV